MECLDDNTVAAYLAHALRADEQTAIVEHLSTCDACLALTCAAGGDGAPAPSTIGRYTIVDVLGQGAMGTVFVARDPQLDRDVALKVVRADRHARTDLQARLAREARAMAKVRHANVVTVYDAGELDDGVFIAMELVSGETLSAWLAEKPRTWREIVEMFVGAARGLAAAHAASIVHRDFKPDNVLVDASGRAAVTDFGVAALRDDTSVPDSDATEVDRVEVTRTGALLGTPRYMSPEQLRGERADARSDQFSFAVALYEALYGALPFRGATVGELAKSIATTTPAPASTRVPASVHRALVRALAPEPARRFASIDALIDALLVALRVSSGRARRYLAIGSVALVVGAAIGAWQLWPRPSATPPPATATNGARMQVLVAPFANTTGEATLDDSLDVATAAVLVASTKLDAMANVELWAQSGGQPPDVDAIAAQRAPNALGGIAILRGRVKRDGAYVVEIEVRDLAKRLLYAGDRRAATRDGLVAATVELAVEAMRALGDMSTPAPAPMTTSIPALHDYAQGQIATLTNPTEAMAKLHASLATDPELAAARASLGLLLYNTQRKAEAIVELERAFRSADNIPERQRLGLMGDYYGVVGRYPEAILAYQQVLAKWPGDGRTQLNLTSTAIDANSWPLALESARAAAERFSRFEVVRRNLVIAELGNNRFTDAVRDGSALLAEVPTASSWAAATLASAYALVGRRADAIATLARVDEDLRAHATADIAAFEGRLDDALAALKGTTGEVDQMVLAHVLLRRGDKAGAIAATRISLREDTMPLAYMAASIAIAAGDTRGADESSVPAEPPAANLTFDDRARAWIDAPEADRRMFGHLLAGDLARARGDLAAARSAYRAASRLGDAWLVHERLARAAIDAHDALEAERELAWCIDHRGTGALVANPSLFLLPEVYLLRARLTGTKAAWQQVSELAPYAQHDPWTEEAHRALR